MRRRCLVRANVQEVLGVQTAVAQIGYCTIRGIMQA